MYLTDAERKVMEQLWTQGSMTAQELSKALEHSAGWKRTTSYTMIDRCIKKGFVRRETPGFLCAPVLTQDAVRCEETEDLLQRNYGGSADLLVAALAGQRRLSLKQMEAIYHTLRELEAEEQA